jgi:hypothetical protein
MEREAWLNGWQRQGDTVIHFHPCCAGCGRCKGVGCIAVDEDAEYPLEPAWPFREADCPVCGGSDARGQQATTIRERIEAARARKVTRVATGGR